MHKPNQQFYGNQLISLLKLRMNCLQLGSEGWREVRGGCNEAGFMHDDWTAFVFTVQFCVGLHDAEFADDVEGQAAACSVALAWRYGLFPFVHCIYIHAFSHHFYPKGFTRRGFKYVVVPLGLEPWTFCM